MTITFLDLYNECAGQPWSMFDNDAESAEDFESSMKISINKAVSFLWNYQPWSFRIVKSKMNTKPNKAAYDLPEGLLYKKVVNGENTYGFLYNKKYLTYAKDYELLDEEQGEPEQFYIEGDTVYIYPTPDDVYTINLKYLSQTYALDKDDNDIYELKEDTDYLNIPERYETLFKNCVISLAMIYAIADESDENHSGYVKQYEDALAVLINYCKTGTVDRNIVW